MAVVLNRVTKELINSANTPEFPIVDWIINPDLSAVTGFPSKYWIITGDVITLMSQAERDAVDAAIVSARRDGTVTTFDEVEDVMRAFARVLLDEINILRTQHSLADRTIAQLKTAIRNKLGT